MFYHVVVGTAILKVVHAWGVDGHAIVADIAERLLSETTRRKALLIVKNESLPAIADWADEYRHSPEGHWTAHLHFADLPDRVCLFEPTRDCVSSECVYGAIMNYTSRLQSEQGAMDLKFLVHLVGDAHQPLHAGFTGDRGGNEVHVTAEFHGKAGEMEDTIAAAGNHQQVNLHAVWDEILLRQSEDELKLQQSGHHDWKVKADAVFKKIDQDVFNRYKTECECPFNCALSILKESTKLACDSAYHSEQGAWVKSGDQLGRSYYESRISVIDQHLINAGIRLAVLIEAAIGGETSPIEADDISIFDA